MSAVRMPMDSGLQDAAADAFIVGLLTAELARLRQREQRWQEAALDCLQSLEEMERDRGAARRCGAELDGLLLELTRTEAGWDRERLRERLAVLRGQLPQPCMPTAGDGVGV